MGTVTTSSFRPYTFDSGTGTFSFAGEAQNVTGTYTEIGGASDNFFEDNEVLLLDGGPTEVQYLGSLTIGGATFLHFQILNGPQTGNYFLDSFDPLPTASFPQTFTTADAGYSDANLAFCFLQGTVIRTPTGDQAIETLAIGDTILTAAGGTTTVEWIGRQSVAPRFAAPRLMPVRIAAGALGFGLPETDLHVTADHGMILDGLVVNAGALVNGSTITALSPDDLPDRVTYYHIETAAHDVILANGAAAETFIDYAGRRGFDNYAEFVALFGPDRPVAEMPLPRIVAARHLPEHLRRRLGMARKVA